jgi:uncharacterized OsmC-like protein
MQQTMDAPAEINGVDLKGLNETILAIQETPDLAEFKFRAQNQWLGGGHNRSTIQSFYGVCQEDVTRTKPFVLDADEPPVLLSRDQGANPVEYVLHALAACMTTSMVYHAAAQGETIENLTSSLEGDLDLQGFLGLSNKARKGYREIRIAFSLHSSASREQLAEFVKMSPVHEMISASVPVKVEFRILNG